MSPLGAGQMVEAGLAGGLAQVVGDSWWALGGWGVSARQEGFQMSEHHRRQKIILYTHTHIYIYIYIYIYMHTHTQNIALAKSSLQRPGPSSS